MTYGLSPSPVALLSASADGPDIDGAMTRVLQAGAIAVRLRNGEPEVFIVRARRNPDDWIFPKGHIDPGEDAPTAAVRELREEGGVTGRAAALVGVSTYALGTRDVQVSYYLVWFEGEAPADETRERAWLTFAEARARLTFDDARAHLDAVMPLVAPPQ